MKKRPANTTPSPKYMKTYDANETHNPQPHIHGGALQPLLNDISLCPRHLCAPPDVFPPILHVLEQLLLGPFGDFPGGLRRGRPVLDTTHRWRHLPLQGGKGSHMDKRGPSTKPVRALAEPVELFQPQARRCQCRRSCPGRLRDHPQPNLSAVKVVLRGLSRVGEVACPGVDAAVAPSALDLSADGSARPLLIQRTLDRFLYGQRGHVWNIEAELLHVLQAQRQHVHNSVQLLRLGRDDPNIALPIHQCQRQPVSACRLWVSAERTHRQVP